MKSPAPEEIHLAAGLQSLGLTLNDTQQEQLQRYTALLQRWNQTYNLSAVEAKNIERKHLLDCLSALPPVQRAFAHWENAKAPRILDVGSGGGLPGVVWAIAWPEAEIHCVDAVGKKAAFIQHCAHSLQLKHLFAHHARVESLDIGPFDLIVSRAFASLSDFAHLSRFHVKQPDGLYLAMKGKPTEEEIHAATEHAQVLRIESLQVPGLQEDRCLVWMQAQPAAANT